MTDKQTYSHARASMPPLPVLHADGLQDDSSALQAWFDGETIAYEDGAMIGSEIRDERLLVTKEIFVNRTRHLKSLSFDSNVITCKGDGGINLGVTMTTASRVGRLYHLKNYYTPSDLLRFGTLTESPNFVRIIFNVFSKAN
jgi:hypothetical protein